MLRLPELNAPFGNRPCSGEILRLIPIVHGQPSIRFLGLGIYNVHCPGIWISSSKLKKAGKKPIRQGGVVEVRREGSQIWQPDNCVRKKQWWNCPQRVSTYGHQLFTKDLQRMEQEWTPGDTFCLYKRPLIASHFTESDGSQIVSRETVNVESRVYEINSIENYLQVLFPVDKQQELGMVAARIRADTPALESFFNTEVAKLRIPSQIPTAEEASQYWNETQFSKKCFFRSFVKPTHVLADYQIIFFEITDRIGSENANLVARTSQGEVLFALWNFNPRDMQKKLISKLKIIQKPTNFCIFTFASQTKTMDLGYFEQFTKRNVGFAYVHTKIKIIPEYINFINEDTLFTLKQTQALPKVCLFSFQNSYVFGSEEAVLMARSGKLQALLNRQNQLLKQESLIIKDININGAESCYRIRELKYAILNLIKIQQSRKFEQSLTDILRQIVEYWLSYVSKWQEKKMQKQLKTQIGHYPTTMKHCKECRVCTRRYNESLKNDKKRKVEGLELKKRKTKYMCEECSAREDKFVPLCVLCFKEYHLHMSDYTDNPSALMSFPDDSVRKTHSETVVKTEEAETDKMNKACSLLGNMEETINSMNSIMSEFEDFVVFVVRGQGPYQGWINAGLPIFPQVIPNPLQLNHNNCDKKPTL